MLLAYRLVPTIADSESTRAQTEQSRFLHQPSPATFNHESFAVNLCPTIVRHRQTFPFALSDIPPHPATLRFFVQNYDLLHSRLRIALITPIDDIATDSWTRHLRSTKWFMTLRATSRRLPLSPKSSSSPRDRAVEYGTRHCQLSSHRSHTCTSHHRHFKERGSCFTKEGLSAVDINKDTTQPTPPVPIRTPSALHRREEHELAEIGTLISHTLLEHVPV